MQIHLMDACVLYQFEFYVRPLILRSLTIVDNCSVCQKCWLAMCNGQISCWLTSCKIKIATMPYPPQCILMEIRCRLNSCYHLLLYVCTLLLIVPRILLPVACWRGMIVGFSFRIMREAFSRLEDSRNIVKVIEKIALHIRSFNWLQQYEQSKWKWC